MKLTAEQVDMVVMDFMKRIDARKASTPLQPPPPFKIQVFKSTVTGEELKKMLALPPTQTTDQVSSNSNAN